LLPFEFVVEDTPKSQQASNNSKRAWKRKVYNEALALWNPGDLPTTDKVQVTVIHFYDTQTPIDIDNILKPIVDALNNLVYIDDSQVSDVIGRKRDFNESFILRDISPLIITSLTKRVEFIYVKIQLAPDPRRLT
jgi:Holliday junction resolvase RusA-like endonuclease